MTSDLADKQASQAKLISELLAACQRATACTGVEVMGALEVAKAQVSMASMLKQMQDRGQTTGN